MLKPFHHVSYWTWPIHHCVVFNEEQVRLEGGGHIATLCVCGNLQSWSAQGLFVFYPWGHSWCKTDVTQKWNIRKRGINVKIFLNSNGETLLNLSRKAFNSNRFTRKMSASGSLTRSDSEGVWEAKRKSSVTVCHIVLSCCSLELINVPEHHFVFTYLMFP